jgi:hypothetical protein
MNRRRDMKASKTLEAARASRVPFVLALLLAASAVGGQTPSGPGGGSAEPVEPRTYGTSIPSVYTIGEFDFTTYDSATTWKATAGVVERYLTTAGDLVASVHLPSGASITGIQIQGCDDSPTGALSATLFSTEIQSGVTHYTDYGSVGTSLSGMPGCGYYFSALSPSTIDNRAQQYFVQLLTGEVDSSVRFSAVRLFYRLQVSPAPANATFADVPTSFLYFRAIEALSASGITSGCGNGNFCPNQFVTRGELAKFLASALGLHWQ